MTISLLMSLIAPLALQSAATIPDKPQSLADLGIEEATAPRCGMAFGVVQGWQEAGDPRGGAWPSMEAANAREFFLTAMVRLIDRYDLERADVTRMVEAQSALFQRDDFASLEAMMPACLILLEAAAPTPA